MFFLIGIVFREWGSEWEFRFFRGIRKGIIDVFFLYIKVRDMNLFYLDKKERGYNIYGVIYYDL